MTSKFGVPWIRVAMLAVVTSACEENGVGPPMLRFGQSGQLVVEVVTPQEFPPSPDKGELRQTLTWRSTGAWQLLESIACRGVVGSEATTRSPGLPAAFAASYATLVAQIHGTAGLDLFIEDLDPGLDPICDPEERETRETHRARVTLRIQDEIRGEEKSWTRCAKGPLGSLDPGGSGPDIHASRVIQVSRLVHDRTLGGSATSVYHNSIPFATLDRGAKSGERDLVSQVFFGGPDEDDAPADWGSFWRWHAGGTPLPGINWKTDMVVVAADGARQEAGSILEIRKIVPTEGAIIQLVELAPGDFCSPAAVVETPFHLVIAPRTGPGIQFSEVALERVPCGL
ncbi:MAG: hypothetical protein F4043_07100 [Gammaproteobacteria bacterium]|nr:hypothetical protein [Gammaproteobacteria bacterium]